MYSTTEIKISKTALLHFVMLTFVLELFKKKKKCYEIYFADIKDLGVGFMVVFLNHVFIWRFGQCTNSGDTVKHKSSSNCKTASVVFLCNIKKNQA